MNSHPSSQPIQSKLALKLPKALTDEFPKASATSEYQAQYLGYLITIKGLVRGRHSQLVLENLEEINEPKVILAIKLNANKNGTRAI